MKIKNLKIYYPAVIVLITLLSFTIFAYYQSEVSATERREKLFERRVQGVSDAISLRMVDYIQILKGCQGLFYGSDSITVRDWKVYTDNLNISSVYPGLQAIAYAAYIPLTDTAQLETSIRQSGFPDFNISSSFKNDFLTPIIFIEPFSGRNLRAFGYDMYSNAARRKAMDRALTTGEAAMTGKVTLVQEADKNIQPGFLLYLPIYDRPEKINNIRDRENSIKGFVYLPFRAYDLMETIRKRFGDVQIEIYEGGSISQEHLFFNSASSKKSSEKDAISHVEFRKLISLNVAGTHWKMVVTSNDRLGSTIEKSQPLMILVFGAMISMLFFMMIFNMVKTNKQVRLELELTKELDNKKDEFIGIASHELKTPLTSIKAYMQLLDRSELGEREKKFVVKANSNIKKLNNLIDDLLDVSKVQSGQLQLNIAPFELKKMISESIENVKHMYSSHQLMIQDDIIPEITLNGDILRLEQAMNNLLLNAIKYSPGSDIVYINTKLEDNQVRIEVIDQGIGISKENREKIFDRFYRARELSPVLSGLGMGLFISAEIIKRHQGKIGVESEFGKGSTFYITLPLTAD